MHYAPDTKALSTLTWKGHEALKRFHTNPHILRENQMAEGPAYEPLASGSEAYKLKVEKLEGIGTSEHHAPPIRISKTKTYCWRYWQLCWCSV